MDLCPETALQTGPGKGDFYEKIQLVLFAPCACFPLQYGGLYGRQYHRK